MSGRLIVIQSHHLKVLKNLLEFYLFLMFVEEVEFGKVIVRIRLNVYPSTIFKSPFPLFGFEEKAFGQISVHDGMHHKLKILVLVRKQVAHIFFKFIFKKKG